MGNLFGGSELALSLGKPNLKETRISRQTVYQLTGERQETAYGQEASGTQWKLGGIGVAEWTGVPLREVLERAGVKATAKTVLLIHLDPRKFYPNKEIIRAWNPLLSLFFCLGSVFVDRAISASCLIQEYNQLVLSFMKFSRRDFER